MRASGGFRCIDTQESVKRTFSIRTNLSNVTVRALASRRTVTTKTLTKRTNTKEGTPSTNYTARAALTPPPAPKGTLSQFYFFLTGFPFPLGPLFQRKTCRYEASCSMYHSWATMSLAILERQAGTADREEYHLDIWADPSSRKLLRLHPCAYDYHQTEERGSLGPLSDSSYRCHKMKQSFAQDNRVDDAVLPTYL
jgi:hypothetical protein